MGSNPTWGTKVIKGKSAEGKFPYQDYNVYGPYLSAKEQRRVLTLLPIKSQGPLNRTTISYARYLYETHYLIKLGPTQVVDHIDNDHLNDDISNLQAITRTENNTKDSLGQLWVMLKCPQCSKEFSVEKRLSHLQKGGRFTSCSRSCRAKISSAIQHGHRSLWSVTSGNVICEFRRPFIPTEQK